MAETELTDQEQEIQAKLSDVHWRINNLYWIQDEKGRKIKFKMNLVQELFFAAIWWINVVLKSRQHGMSTLVNIMQLDQCLFNRDQTAGIVDKTDADATKKLDKIKYAYDHLDDTDEPGEGHVDTSRLGAAIKEAVPWIKRNDHEFNFSNGSKIWTGTSLRGGTCQFLHISELGPIAHNFPNRAEEIRSGALNTVHVGCKIVIESTHEGGESGLNYEMIDLAMTSPPREHMSQLDWQFHFFAWWQDPKNRLPLTRQGLILTDEQRKYFQELDRDHSIPLDPEQKHWYVKKWATQKDAMFKEHPSIPEEALQAAVKGAIYGKYLTALKKAGRVRDFQHDTQAPLFTFWDLGKKDFTSIWLIQFTGMEFCLLNYFSWQGEDARFYAAKVFEWEQEYGFISGHYMPHDARNNSGPGLTWLQAYEEAGLTNITVVPVTPDKWIGIRHLRGLLPRCWIHKTNCGRKWKINEHVIIPSGLAVLQGYRTKVQETGGKIDEMPVHDECSHGCLAGDSLITMGDRTLKRIDEINAGDYVLTPAGPCLVAKKWNNGIRATLALGNLRLTGDHRVFTGQGLAHVDSVGSIADVWTLPKPLNFKESFTTGITTTTSRLLQPAKTMATCIALFGRAITDRFRPVAMSTIRTVIHSIMIRLTWNGSLTDGRRTKFVSFVQSLSRRWSLITSSVRGFANKDTATRLLHRELLDRVKSAGDHLSINQKDTCANTVHRHVKTRLEISSGKRGEPVYDLLVEGAHCYYANGILVSNCDALRAFSEAHLRGMLTGNTEMEKQSQRRQGPKVITGVHGCIDDRRPNRKIQVLR